MRPGKFGGEGGRGERAGSEDGDGVGRVLAEGEDLFAVNGDAGLGCDAGGYSPGEFHSIPLRGRGRRGRRLRLPQQAKPGTSPALFPA